MAGYRRRGTDNTPLNINIKWIIVGVILVGVSVFIGTFSAIGFLWCFLFGISSILYSIGRTITYRVGLGFFVAALVVFGIGLKLFLFG